MKYADFPLLGRRPFTEFSISGVLEPEPAELGEWTAARWVFERASVPRERVEWWYHGASRLWFRVRRDTGSDTIVAIEPARTGSRT